MNTRLEKYKTNLKFRIVFNELSLLFRYRFSHWMFYWFWVEFHPKTEPKSISFSDQKTILFATLSFMLIFMLNLVTILALLAPFRSLSDPFWLTFGSLLAPFGSLLVPLGSLLLTWRSIFSLLGSPGAIFNIAWYFRWESYVKWGGNVH